MYTNLLIKLFFLTCCFYGVLLTKHIRWGDDPCILIDIDAYNNLEWIDRNGKVTIATNFSFDDVEITEGGCDLPNPWVGGLWQDGKGFELVFYNNSGTADVQMNIYYNPSEVFKHNLSENVRNIVSFPTCSVGKAYRCEIPVSHVTKVHVGKEAYRYSFGVSSILIQGFGVEGEKYSKVEECPQDMTSSKKSSISTFSTPSSTHPSSHSTPSKTHPTSHSTPSKHPSSYSTPLSSHSNSHSSSSTSHSTRPSKSTPTTHPSSHSTPSSTHSSGHSTHSSSNPTHPSSHSTSPSSHSTHPSSHSTHTSSNTSTKPTTHTPAPIPDDPSTSSKQIFNTKCMKMIGEFKLNVSYPSSTPGMNKSAIFSVNDINFVNGSCGKSTIDVLYVTFYNKWQMNITVKTENGKEGTIGDGASRSDYWWSHVYLKYFYNTTSVSKKQFFPDIDPKIENGTVTISKGLKGKTFEANINSSYLCHSTKTINLGYGSSFIVSNLQYNAFQDNPNNTFFDKVTKCTEDKHDTNGNTYIYVGVGIGVLVAMVMVVYIAGRCCYRKNYEEL